ncbi:protein FAM3A-like [Myripristis murdjan]|uniref:protein FAM3A-like n=1 Tax=Myripristis murdjan TaxID=586833 RepID=UPI001175F2EF|nr:protein FAM3A-like [Myripristis murdjan]
MLTEPHPQRYKCGLSPCPQKHLAFRLVSETGFKSVWGAECKYSLSVPHLFGSGFSLGPLIFVDTPSVLVSSVKNNVGRGINIALVNGVTGDLLDTKSFDMWAGDVSDLLKFLRPLHEGTLVFVASFDDAATK